MLCLLLLALMISLCLLPVVNKKAKDCNETCEQQKSKEAGEESLQDDVRYRFLSVRH